MSRSIRYGVPIVVSIGMALTIGCNPGSALGLQDWGRDLLGWGTGALFAALAAANVPAQTAQETPVQAPMMQQMQGMMQQMQGMMGRGEMMMDPSGM